ncbi:MAG: WecB/TagA/CpsF family glycosyltransferase, partial [Nocardioidaceae bacterium]
MSSRIQGGGVTTVPVGPFQVMDATRADFVAHVVGQVDPAGGADGSGAAAAPVLVYALHVGGLNARRDARFVEAMRRAAVVYADGGSVVWLARLAGAQVIERAPTTDVGWDIVRELAVVLGRPPRVALIGGPEGLAERAGQVLAQEASVEVVLSDHGFHDDWTQTLESLRETAPDLVLVGLGAPAEMVWSEDHRDRLPGAVVLTVGGWFGHLVGDERRAPRVLRRSGVEWVARLAQSPRRLGPRYARGLWSSAAMSVPAWRRR